MQNLPISGIFLLQTLVFDSIFYYFISIQYSRKVFEAILITLMAEMKFLQG
jgi:hypothetical protein